MLDLRQKGERGIQSIWVLFLAHKARQLVPEALLRVYVKFRDRNLEPMVFFGVWGPINERAGEIGVVILQFLSAIFLNGL